MTHFPAQGKDNTPEHSVATFLRAAAYCAAMISRTVLVFGVLIALSRLSTGAEPVKQKVDLLGVIKSGDVTYYLNEKQTLHDPPKSIWSFNDDGQLKISGKGFGYVATKQSYKDYHLVIEYKFPGPTFGTRTDKARDNGIILHGHGPDGSYAGTWMAGIEAQIIEGGTGDILVLSGKTEDGKDIPTSLSAEFARDPNKQMIWKKGEPRQTVTKGRINWEKRSPAWKDEAGFLSKDDVQSRYNEWTRYEVIAKGNTLQYIVNGVLVNEAFDCNPGEGKICLQTEGAEMLVRRFELYPLGEFQEKWSSVSAAGGTEVPVLEPRSEAWTPEQEQKAIVLDGNYDVQLVAAEPLVRDPVEVTWDAKGRCFVADMMDYPLGPPPGEKPLSRIQMLLDPDKNGRYTRAVTFADHVDHVQGLLPWKDGLIATTRTEILFLRDTNGDGVADEIKPLVEGFNPSHSQLQVSAPRWGLDGCVYFNNGLNTAEIYPAQDPNEKQNFTRCNLRWDPVTGKLSPSSGFGQYGGCFDDWGHHFFCSNRNPVMFAVMPYEAVIRNPHSGITQGWEDIAPTGADAKVFPLQLTHTTADAHAGTHTAACGLGVYRGDLMPELRGEIFVCEPTAQSVVRYHPEISGASLKATRVGDHKEFFSSRDEWCRPVNVTTGPDGALYVCDIYRRFIDHARFFPEQFAKTHNMRAGDTEGRIWRVVPKGGKVRAITPAPEKVEGLVAWLGNQNSWQRETAQRLLVAKLRAEVDRWADEASKPGFDPLKVKSPVVESFWNAVIKTSPTPLFVLHAFSAITGAERNDLLEKSDKKLVKSKISAELLGDDRLVEAYLARCVRLNEHPHSRIIDYVSRAGNARCRFLLDQVAAGTSDDHLAKYCLESIAHYPDDEWVLKGVAAAALNVEGQVAKQAILSGFGGKYSQERAVLLKTLASNSAAAAEDGSASNFTDLVGLFRIAPGELLWWKSALLQGLADGLPKAKGKARFASLTDFVSKSPNDENAKEIGALLLKAEQVMTDSAAPLDQRLALLPLVAQRTWDKAEPIMRGLFAEGQPPEITNGALLVLKKFSSDKTSPLLYELLPKLGPAERREIVTMLSSGKTLLDFLQRMDRGEISKSLVGVEQRWGYEHNSNKEIKALAHKLFGSTNSDRAAVINSYMEVTKLQGDAQRGHLVFQTICIACHKIRGEGVEVGPDITDVRIKPTDALLTDILDPNRIVEPRFNAYQVDVKDGRILSGIVAAENSDGVTLKMPGGISEAIPRANIKTMKCLDQSLMPVGLEAGINKQQMADLLAFLKGP